MHRALLRFCLGDGLDQVLIEQQLQPGAAAALPQWLQGKLLKASAVRTQLSALRNEARFRTLH
jgi:hypothetical protein